MIRAIPTNTTDRVYCKVLGQGAVHGAFAGYTGFTVGLVNTHYVYLPIPTIIQVCEAGSGIGDVQRCHWGGLNWHLLELCIQAAEGQSAPLRVYV